MADKDAKHLEIPFNGKLITNEPAMIGNNFRTLKNLRYTDTHLKGVQGMTKINAAAVMDATYLKTRSGYHFRKLSPVESHVIVQAYNAGLTASKLLDNSTAIPSTGSFSATALWTDTSGALIGYFCDAPDGQLIYCNGVDNCIWGGTETRLGAFITSTAVLTDTGAATTPIDCTDKANNTKTDSENIVVIGGGIDSYTKLLLHGDGSDASTTITDSETAPKAVTAADGTAIDTSWAKFGSGSILFDGSSDIQTNDHADWNFSTNAMTIDFWVRFSALTGYHCLFSQAYHTNYVTLYYDNYQNKIVFSVMTAGVRILLQEVAWTPVINTWYHFALIRGWGGGANAWAITINGATIGTFTEAGTLPNVATGTVCIGRSSVITAFDSGNTGHGITSADASVSGAAQKFSYGSILFGGAAGDNGLKIADHADFSFGTGNFVVEMWVRFSELAAIEYLASQRADADNYWRLYKTAAEKLNLKFRSGAADIAEYEMTNAWAGIAINTWYHVAFSRSTDTIYIFINGVSQALTAVVALGAGANVGNVAGELVIGNYAGGASFNGYMQEIRISKGTDRSWGAAGFTPSTTPYTSDASTVLLIHGNLISLWGWIDEYRISNGIARWVAAFTPPTRPYTKACDTWLVGTTRPIQGVKYYVQTGNVVASTMTGYEWNGTTWSALTLTDNTDTGSTLAVTGTVTFSSTVTTAKPKYLEGYYLYWYMFHTDAGEAELYHVSVDAPFQNIVDIWDGVFRDMMRFYKYTTSYTDYTINVLEDDYYVSSPETYADISSLPLYASPNYFLEIGFAEPMVAIQFMIPPDYTNSTAATTMSVDYWNGSEYVGVASITDGTSTGAISFGMSGVVSWNNNSLIQETPKVVANSPPLYFYRVKFDKNLDASVRVNYVSGIPAQATLKYFRFPVFTQGRILLCNDTTGYRNKAICSAQYMPQVFNGGDTAELYFGEEGDLTCGIELFSQFGSTLFSLILMFKDYEMWVMAGQQIEDWQKSMYLASSSIGCPAPFTLKRISMGGGGEPTLSRNMAIWQGANGVYLSDGRAPIPIHGDIKEYFDPADSRCILSSKIGDSVAWIDPQLSEYHLLVASGSGATSLNTELVYDIYRNRWFEIDRGSDLQYGLEVHDTDGKSYDYGFLDTGYMERLENGTDFDGTDITHTLQMGDIAPAGLSYATRISKVKFFTVAKTTTTNNITCTHTRDTGTKTTAVAAAGTVTFTGVPVTAETFAIDTQTFTWKVARAITGDVEIGVDATACNSNLIVAMSADISTVIATTASARSALITAATDGLLSGMTAFTESCTNMSMNGSGTLGGTTAGADATSVSKTMSPARTNYRVATPTFIDKLNGDPFHSLKFEMITDNETVGFEPMAVAITYHVVQED